MKRWLKVGQILFVETKSGVWEPVEMKGKADSPWTRAQKKYLPALQKGAEFETIGEKNFPSGYKGSGGGKVFDIDSVVTGKFDFRKLITTSYTKFPQGDRTKGEKVTITRDRDNNIINQTVEPDTKLGPKIKQQIKEIADSNIMKKMASSKGAKVVAAVTPILLSGVAKAAPGIGIVAGAADVASEVNEGNGRRAVLAGIGMSEIPFVSQTADIGLAVEDAAWVAKEILDPEQKLEDWYYRTFLK